MPRKVALLIGVSKYGEGIPPLSAPPNDVAAMKRVLEDPKMGGFEVETLLNPEPIPMQMAIKKLFTSYGKEDLVLLFFSGHGITNDDNRLYLATRITAKDHFDITAVPASFVQQQSKNSYTKRQAIVLDCCYSGAYAEGWQAKSVGLDLEKELGAEGRVVLTSSMATQTSFQQEDAELSLYTQYLVEGIETGAADKDGDGKIHAHELHEYAKAKMKEAKPKMEPGIIIDREGFNILLSKAPINDPVLRYRQWVEKYATDGEITVAGDYILRVKRQELGITAQKSDEIINEVLAPYHKRRENINVYKRALIKAVEKSYPLTKRLLNELQDLQDVLGLEDKDIAEVKQQILGEKEAEHLKQEEAERQRQQEAERLKQREVEERLRLKQEAEQQQQQAKTQPSPVKEPQTTIKTQPFDFEVGTISITKSGWFGGTKVEINRSWSRAEFFAEDLGDGVILEMVAIPGGTFQMGSDEDESEKPIHRVTVPPFYLGKYPVTQAQWQAVAKLPKVKIDLNSEPSSFKGMNRPVEKVSWDDAVEFCERLSHKTGRSYRLPSEAEWEYACRACTGERLFAPTPFHFGETISTDLANYDGNFTYGSGVKGQYRQETTKVGSFPANNFGLFDMHGNVWEWCADPWHENYNRAPTVGSVWKLENDNHDRLVRGGSWCYLPKNCRSANRSRYQRDYRYDCIGFRVAVSLAR